MNNTADFPCVKNFLAFIFQPCIIRFMTVDQIVKHFGGKTQAARALGFHLQTLRDWRKNGIPIKTQAWIQFETGGALKATKPISAK